MGVGFLWGHRAVGRKAQSRAVGITLSGSPGSGGLSSFPLLPVTLAAHECCIELCLKRPPGWWCEEEQN